MLMGVLKRAGKQAATKANTVASAPHGRAAIR